MTEEKKFQLSDEEKLALIKIAIDTYNDYTDDYDRVFRVREILRHE